MGTQQRWLPFLGDVVLVRIGALTVNGTAATFDASLVLVAQPVPGLAIGDPVEATWWVGADRRDAVAEVDSADAEGFSVRLAPEPAELSRRASERLTLSVPLRVTPTREGSLGGVASDARSIDVSDGGMRVLFDQVSALDVGEYVQVEVDLGATTERLVAAVAWRREQVAGLRFRHQVQAASWQQLVSA